MDFIRITKRDDLPRNREIIITILAVVLSIVLAGIILIIFGLNPFNIFKEIIAGSVGTSLRIRQTLVKAIPLVIASMGIIVAFKMKFWNIGAEGQITMGALGASWVALNLSDSLPQPVMLLLMIIAAAVCGGIWAFIPAIFKAKMGTNETIFTLMMNYVAIKFVTYLQYGPWMDPAANGFPRIAKFSENAILPSLGGVHIGWILAIILTAFVYVFIRHTKTGYEVAVVGESLETARYAGMNISKVIIISMLISGGLCGIVGMVQASAIEKTLVAGIANNYGFTAIITAWLAKLNPISTLVVCVVFAMLIQGGEYIQIALGVPSSVSDIVQGLVLFFVLGSEFFMRYRVHLGKPSEKEVA
ncbi:ABC transporter permease [bacterium 210820-DFI.6.37]|nr:ABC transporter permease [bacterium 210820-DFI.6.37]